MIGLIDCNNFYCSCERVFQPELIGKPLIVLSNNDGCAISRSDEAKALGINMGTPAFMIDDLIKKHNVQVRSSNYTLYGDMSERVMAIIKGHVTKVEIYSIDEIFVDFSGLEHNDLKALAAQIRSEIMQCTGIPVCIGMAPTKTLAKMANRYAKKKHKEIGIYWAGCAATVSQMQQATEVEAIWGIGREYAKLLAENGFKTAADLMGAPEAWVRKNLSVIGLRLVTELKGTRCLAWEAAPPPKKNICVSRSFGQVLTDKRPIAQAIAAHTATAAIKLRNEQTCAQKIEVFIQTNPHRGADRQYSASVCLQLPVATNATRELITYALKGLALIYKPGYFYQKAGINLQNLVGENRLQLALFDTVNRTRDKKVTAAMDAVNARYGRHSLRFGVHDYGRKWKLKAERLSPCFTTRFADIPKAKAT